ncbi:MAG TPA: glycosyltransferase family 2 protein [Chitinophagales bacterium]|nr:glycosyltransferase family 2 protein [Chitinophagales bacterium]
MIDLSVVILGYKSEFFLLQFVEQVISELKLADIHSFEIILVANYDNDKDTTPQISQFIQQKYDFVKSITKKKEGKMGWDMRMGMEAASGQYICVLDGDGQMPVSDVVTVFNIINKGQYDLVKTYRHYRYDGFYRTLISKVYNILFTIIYRPKVAIKDVNSKPKILSRTAFDQLNLISNDWFTDAEIMIQALKLNFRICQVSTVFYKNERRKSYVGFNTIFEFIYNLFYYRLKN